MITAADLRQFTGTEQWYRHSLFPKITYTEGTKFVAEECGAYWLLDAVVSHQLDKKVRAEEFQVWKLRVEGSKATLTCEDGNKNVVTVQKIEFTDFPLAEIDLWCSNNVIMLPSEY